MLGRTLLGCRGFICYVAALDARVCEGNMSECRSLVSVATFDAQHAVITVNSLAQRRSQRHVNDEDKHGIGEIEPATEWRRLVEVVLEDQEPNGGRKKEEHD